MSGERPLAILQIDTERGWRGGQRQVLWLAAALRALGHRSILAAPAAEPLAARAADAGLKVLPLPSRTTPVIVAAYRIRKAIRTLGIEVVNTHDSRAVLLGALATRGTEAALVATRRVDVPLRDNALTRWKYGCADRIIAVSSAIAGTLRAGTVAAERVAVVRDGTDLTRMPDRVAPEVLREIGVPAGAPWALQAAALDRGKDPLTFVRAVGEARRTVPDLHGVMAGAGPLGPRVRQEIDALGLTGTVHLAGYRSDVDTLIVSASVVTLSSVAEGLGTVLLDAMAFGTPVAATRSGGIPEIVRDEETGLLAPPGDAAALGAAIARIVVDRALAARLARTARAAVEDLSVPMLAERTLREYRRALADRRGG